MENVFFDDSISDEIFKTYDEINKNFDTPALKCESENEKLFDIISQLFEENKVESIWINGHDNVKIESENNELKTIDNLFSSNNQLEKFIKYLSQMSNQKFGSNNFIIEGNLKSNLLFMGVLPYNYQSVPILLIRKTEENILVDNNYDNSIIKYLKNAINNKLNILIAGKTKSGKTTLINYLLKNFEKEQKCIVIENSISAVNIKSHFPKINITPFYATDEIGDNEILSRKLLNKLLLIEASNLILDELTIGDVSEFLIYIDSYFRGSVFSINANDAKDAISKIKKMIKYGSNNINSFKLKRLVQTSIDVVVEVKNVNNAIKIDKIYEMNTDFEAPELLKLIYQLEEDQSYQTINEPKYRKEKHMLNEYNLFDSKPEEQHENKLKKLSNQIKKSKKIKEKLANLKKNKN